MLCGDLTIFKMKSVCVFSARPISRGVARNFNLGGINFNWGAEWHDIASVLGHRRKYHINISYVDCFFLGDIYTDIPPVATPLPISLPESNRDSALVVNQWSISH